MGTERTELMADSSASGSGSSNTTKTNSTDNSSHHSNASTAPSSADLNVQEDWRSANKRDAPTQHTSKSSPSGILKSTGRSWSFGGSKKQLPSVPAADEDIPVTPPVPVQYRSGRARATTTSTDATITPPQLDQDIGFDIDGNFTNMFSGFDKRSSAMTLKDGNGRQVLPPAATTGGRLNAPSPIHVDKTSKVEAPQHSWASHRSQHSSDNLLSVSPMTESTNENAPPPVPRHEEEHRPQAPRLSTSDNLLKRTSAMFTGRRKSVTRSPETPEGDDLDTALLAVSRYMSDGHSRTPTPTDALGGRYRRNEEASGPGYKVVHTEAPTVKFGSPEDDNLFDNVPLNTERYNSPHQLQEEQVELQATNKVMTTSEFEKYRKHKEVENRRAEMERLREKIADVDDEDEINYDDDEDEIEKSKQLAKQRRKQEAHMSVYRQQMMKVTGETADMPASRPSMQISFSSPNLSVPESSKNPSDVSEDDEEVPLAILAAHGFPSRNRPPARLTSMMSNPNLRQAAQPSYQRPGSAIGHGQTASGSLPPFARGLPQDPYGLVNAPPRESFALGGGVPAGQPSPMPPGGLVGVIAHEERSRAMRRGSPQVAQMDNFGGASPMGPGGFDPIHGIPAQMMYPPPMPMVSPGEQAQIQLNQQMTQFMQMQMQFMQMMTNNNNPVNGPPRSAGHVGANSTSAAPGMNGIGMMGMDVNRDSFLEPPSLDPRGDMHGRTMSMVQPSSASWLQPPQPGYAGSIRAQGDGYAPSLAPSERSNVGLPGRYRPVSHIPMASGTTPDHIRTSTMSGTLSPFSESQTVRAVNSSPSKTSSVNKSARVEADDDEEEGWAAMKAKRDNRKSTWRIRKTLAPGELDISSLIT